MQWTVQPHQGLNEFENTGYITRSRQPVKLADTTGFASSCLLLAPDTVVEIQRDHCPTSIRGVQLLATGMVAVAYT